MDPHRLAELTSIRLHAAVAERLAEDPSILARARARVARWLETGEVAAFYAKAWAEVLARPPDELSSVLVEDTDNARALRQVSPFAGALDARARWAVWREARAASQGVT